MGPWEVPLGPPETVWAPKASDGLFGCTDGALGGFDVAFGGLFGEFEMDGWLDGQTLL